MESLTTSEKINPASNHYTLYPSQFFLDPN